MQTIAYIGLGGNIGDCHRTLKSAERMIGEIESTTVEKISGFIETEPVGGPPRQPKYLNAVAEISTSLSPVELLEELQTIESTLGRDRFLEERYGPRTCDLDILLYGDCQIDTTVLTIPHPRMHFREFVLNPLVEIAPHAVNPQMRKTAKEMLDDLNQDRQKPIPTLISVIGPMAAGKTTLAQMLSSDLEAELIYEDFAGNPFITAATAGDPWTLPSQMYFLLSRVDQLSPKKMFDLKPTVADYGFCQDRIYAEILLEGEDLLAYKHLYSQFNKLIVQPSVLIHCDASLDVLMDRIARRGRDFEAAVDRSFVKELRDRHFELQIDEKCQLVNYDTSNAEAEDGSRYNRLLEEIRKLI